MRVVHARVCVALLVSYSIDNRQLLRTMTSGHRLDVAAISSAVAGAVTQALRMQQQGEPGSNAAFSECHTKNSYTVFATIIII